jgi:catechol 2,3-dioxygenase-like lactoylglutathione lyase family enzyme
MRLDRIDHFVLTVRDIEATCAFYSSLGMEVVTFGQGRKALAFGGQKINLHQAGHEFEPKAHRPTPGSADFCLITSTPLDQVVAEICAQHIPIIEGPVQRTGAAGSILSIYVRDPDENLVEIAQYVRA